MLLPRPSLPARTTLWAAPLLALALAGAPLQAQETFTNLQFFPEDITRGELMENMRDFAFALGVRCTYCHAGEEGVPFNQRDWASDEKATKRKAREMLAMAERFDAAERMLLLNLEFNPESAQSMTSLGQLFDRQGDVQRAVDWYRRSLEVAPENAAIRRRLEQLIGG